MRLKDKTAIVTGGAAGIGQATAELFAEEGASVAIFDIDEGAGGQTADRITEKGGKAIFIQTDVSDEASASKGIDETKRRFGRLDILVNNAAAFVLKGLEATTADWKRVLDVNVVGTALCSRYAVREMKKAGGGAIVNLGSISSFIAQPEFVTYSSTKAAILQMTRNMALDLGPHGIRVNCVCPGTILTRASRDHMEQAGMTLEEFVVEEGPKHILGRIGQPREVAYAILFLASDEASFITGAHLMVDGGYTAIWSGYAALGYYFDHEPRLKDSIAATSIRLHWSRPGDGAAAATNIRLHWSRPSDAAIAESDSFLEALSTEDAFEAAE